MEHIICELCYKRKILQRNKRKMTILLSFSFKSFVKFHGKNMGVQHDRVFIMRCVIKGLHC